MIAIFVIGEDFKENNMIYKLYWMKSKVESKIDKNVKV